MSQQRFFSLLSFLFLTTCAFGQYEYFRPTVVTTDYTKQLAGTFKKATVTSLNSKAIKQYVQGKTTANISLAIGNRIVNVSLTPHSVMSPNMKLIIAGKNNERQEIVYNENVNYVGYTQDGFQAVMTIDEGYISGYFYKGKEAFFIEPLMVFMQGAPADVFVSYKREDIIPRESSCPVEDNKKKVEENATNTMMLRLPPLGTYASKNPNLMQTVTPPTMALSAVSTGNGCTKIKLALVTPYDMFLQYGSANAVRNRVASIVAATNTDYDDDFNKVIEFSIESFVIETSPTARYSTLIGDTMRTTAGMVPPLNTFRNEGGYGSGVTFDVAGVFLRRRFRAPDESTIGVANTDAMCTSVAFNMQTDGMSLDEQRGTFSHELGHNFGCGHIDGGIMNFFIVLGVKEWSPGSVLDINNKEASADCNLGSYALGGTAAPNFEVLSTYCVDQIVRLKSDSTKRPTSFAWSIPNGSTTSGNARSVQTSFSAPGNYPVTHTVGNNVACTNGGISAAFSKTKTLRVINFRNKTYPSNFTSTFTMNEDGASFGFGIMNVKLLDIDNTTGDNSATLDNDGAIYLDFTCSKFTLIPAGTTSATISVLTGMQNESGNAWIDWNNDGTFDNATERILSSSSGFNKTHTATFAIPSTAVKNQMLTLRVIDKRSSLAVDAISNTAIAQVEDYGVILSDNCAGVVPTITASGSTTFCEGDSVTLTSSATTGNVWSTGETTRSITVNISGNYFVSVTNASACIATSLITTVTVNPKARKPSISSDMPLIFCPSANVQLYSSSSTSYLWSNGAISQTTNITATGKYAVTTTDGNGCRATSDSVYVEKKVAAPAIITASGPLNFCTGGSVTLTSNVSTGNVWSTGESTQSIVVTTAGAYTLRVTDTSACNTVTTSTPANIVVNSLPNISEAVASPNPVCSDAAISLSAKSFPQKSLLATLGTGAILTNPFFLSTFDGGQKSQYLIRASELRALGLIAGNVTSLGVRYAPPSTTPTAVNNFSIQMGHTALSDLSGGITSSAALTLVYSVASMVAVADVNTFTFSTPFVWDGTSNILVQVCWSNNNSGVFSGVIRDRGDNLSYVASAFYTADNQTVSAICANTTTTSKKSQRPQFYINGQTGIDSTALLNWYWNTSPASTGSDTITRVTNATADPLNRSFIVTATNPTTSCSNTLNTNTITIKASKSTVTASGSTNLPAGGSVTLTSPVATGNTWSNGATTQSITVNTAGTYTTTYTDGSGCSITSTPIVVTVGAAPVVIPSVSISASNTSICSGTSVTFTATPTNGGTTPSYQWKLNNVNVGTNSSTYSNSSLANGDIVTCVLTSNAAGASPTTATSNSVTMTVTANVTPSVSISANSTTITAGTNVTFTATPTNGGTTPSYQWKLNNVNVGTNSTTYNNASLTSDNIVSCVITSNATCASPTTATSNSVTITVTAAVTVYNATFDMSGTTSAAPSNLTGVSEVTAAQAGTPTKADSIFVAWFTTVDRTGTAISFPFNLTDNTTFYPKFTPKNYAVTFDGVVLAPLSVRRVETSPIAPTKADSTFVAWYTTPNRTTAVTFPLDIRADVTWSAKYNFQATYSVSFSSEGTITNAPSNLTNAIQVTAEQAKIPVRAGYIFVAWFTDAAFTNKAVFPITLTANLTLYAKWTLSSTCVIPIVAPEIIKTSEGLSSSNTNFIEYKWYLNNVVHATTRTPFSNFTQPGVYNVSGTDANGCISPLSKKYYYSPTCAVPFARYGNATSIQGNIIDQAKIIVRWCADVIVKDITVRVYDLNGTNVYTENFNANTGTVAIEKANLSCTQCLLHVLDSEGQLLEVSDVIVNEK